jgi:lipoprotein NlpD
VLTETRIIRRICFVCCLILLTAACSTSRMVNWNPDDYTVRSGDSIYSIAWKYELDPFEMARWNRIPSPYVIHPGQRLHTRDMGDSAVEVTRAETPATRPSESKPRSAAAPVSAASRITVREGDTLYRLAKRNGMSAAKLARINGLRSPYMIKPGQTLALKSRPESRSHKSGATTNVASTATSGVRHKPKPKPKARGSSSTAKLELNNKQVRWSWPVTGTIVNRFNNARSDSKGIDIAGREGSPVQAAAPGKVVYSGNGLISYGNLVIIKHNRSYLSAYAYNRKLLVSEGDTVKAGQKIAEMGRTGTDSPRLHFEIRKNGKPVNPLSYLPSS